MIYFIQYVLWEILKFGLVIIELYVKFLSSDGFPMLRFDRYKFILKVWWVMGYSGEQGLSDDTPQAQFG